MSLNAELHRHLGGSVVPRIFWRYLHRTGHALAARFPDYASCETFFTEPRASLTEYLELHSVVEEVQRLETIPYFVTKLVRGAYVFESICYLELRHTPYLRTDPKLPVPDRIAAMQAIVEAIAASSEIKEYPIFVRQILCMHSRLPHEINVATLKLAAKMKHDVCGIDLAGPDTQYAARMGEYIELFEQARTLGIKTTGHLFETENGNHPELLPLLDRIGHGIQIPLQFPHLLDEVAKRGQCLEVCPTTYLKTGTMKDLTELRVVFERCEAAGVDIAICTDNAGLHNVRLPFEIENLLTLDVIDFAQLRRCQEAAYRHAFAWPFSGPPDPLKHSARDLVL